ncbi:MAG: endonuclease/exonuclease/phosphatase family protein [Cytophagales bacterium]|nr:endonuclease/exonuclease/phosphatase family protein [Cytophagales bacterium]
MTKYSSRLLVASMAITAITSLLSFFSGPNWILDLFSHFKWQYLLALTCGTVILAFKKTKLSLIFLPFIFILIMEIVPFYFGGNKNISLTKTTKIICINLLSSNMEFKLVENYINQNNPDIILLQEFNTIWQSQLEPKLQEYPHRLTIPRNDNFGMALYSKGKITNLKTLTFGDLDIPSIQGAIEIGSAVVQLIATHPLPPVGADYFQHRNSQLAELGLYIAELDSEVILIGDLNTTSFSTHFKKLTSTAKLIDTRRGFGELTTWPTWFSPARTTLDHCLISAGLSVKSRKVGENIGSDHLPISVEIGVE